MSAYKAGLMLALSVVAFDSNAKNTSGAPTSGHAFGIEAQVTNGAALAIGGDFYTQVHINVKAPDIPTDKSKRKLMISALLSALGAKTQDSRSITVTAQVTSGNITLPEYTLISFSINRKNNTIVADDNNGIVLPLHRLDADQSILVKVTYRDVKDSEVDLKALGQTIGAVVPGNFLLNAVSEPLVQKVANIGSAFLTSMSSGSLQSTHSETLSPYAANPKEINFKLTSPAGESMGEVSVSLWGTPTLLRPARLVTTAPTGGYNDLVRSAGEDPTNMSYTVGGVTTSYAEELQKLPSFVALLQDKGSKQKVKDFCSAAIQQLDVTHRLTSLDRLHVLYDEMLAIDYPDQGDGAFEWFNGCFLPEQRVVLKRAMNVDPPVPQLKAPDTIKDKNLWALGCWMAKVADSGCATESPDPEAILKDLFADQVTIAIDSSFLEHVSLGDGETASKSELMTAMHGSISDFRCFKKGHMLLRTDNEHWFLLEGEINNKRLDRLNIRSVSSSLQACRS